MCQTGVPDSLLLLQGRATGAVLPAKPCPNDAYRYHHSGFYTYLRLLTHAAPSEQLR